MRTTFRAGSPRAGRPRRRLRRRKEAGAVDGSDLAGGHGTHQDRRQREEQIADLVGAGEAEGDAAQGAQLVAELVEVMVARTVETTSADDGAEVGGSMPGQTPIGEVRVRE